MEPHRWYMVHCSKKATAAKAVRDYHSKMHGLQGLATLRRRAAPDIAANAATYIALHVQHCAAMLHYQPFGAPRAIYTRRGSS
jgi:hypothetical protein